MGFFILHMDRRERTSIFYKRGVLYYPQEGEGLLYFTQGREGLLHSTLGQDEKDVNVLHKDRKERPLYSPHKDRRERTSIYYKTGVL